MRSELHSLQQHGNEWSFLGAVRFFRGQSKALKLNSTIFPHIDLQYLVGEVAILREFVEDQSKDLFLQVQVQAKW